MNDSIEPKTVTALILGAAGYGGGELLRLLHAHPAVGDVQAVSASHADQPWHAAHPRLRGFVPGVFNARPDFEALALAEHLVIFSAQPNGRLAGQWPDLQAQLLDHGLYEKSRVIDLSGDFRLTDPAEYQAAYGQAHPCPEWLDQWEYGLSEHRGEELAGAKLISNPGCFATAIQLALKPLLSLGVPDWVSINGVTGSSGSGVHPSANTHHPERANDFRAYKVLAHQHEAEVRAALSNGQRPLPTLAFVPHSAPMTRGIFITLQARLPDLTRDELLQGYEWYYGKAPFIRLSESSPRIHAVVGSNACDIGLQVHEGQVVVMAALDNLIKGMAGQAVQNMNLSLGLPESSGLGLL
ncbi:N-acetyl-gamma-glutamyl-phosphate reductase [Natronospira proteinivora]|uniref:N-acetyl-gamma-glutamyl-phosphate reductase n=1 Tax=Natronospira proteinivora TaxID=1807133 RepID=A0ABT1G8Y3_9GAMM|nr:N-acetyl-gamma-glutamyl-phosphate reductase [Natronospira proteinivora]MCP1727776.1 N-acetyl-gamma-glutamyl-phosphate reductase [Natronospira proteinivora]